MKSSPELLNVAHHVVWFKPAEEALKDTDWFLAHVMTYGTIAEVTTVKKYFTRDDFVHALENAPPGVFDARSWAFWNTCMDRTPVPPMPERTFCKRRSVDSR